MINFIWQNFISGGKVLDLGCGQGRDVIFLANQGFLVTAVDKSDVAIHQLAIKKDELGLENLNLVCRDLLEFELSKDEYQVIICRNVLNFLNKETALKIIKEMQESVQTGGYIIIEVFTKNDSSFLAENKFLSYFDEQELLKIFSDYDIAYYFENIIFDSGHPGFPAPHKHGVSKIIAKKRN